MRMWGVAVMLGLAAATGARSADDAARAELAPSGTVRIALVEAPNAGVFFVARALDGTPKGVTADLGADLARTIGVPVAFAVFPNSGEATDALRSGAVDVSFMPVDATRRAVVAFGPSYYELENTYLVTEASGVTDVAGIDRPGLRVIGIANTTTIRAAARTLTRTQPVPVVSVAAATALMRDGGADAFALSRDTLPAIRAAVPGSRIATGSFQRTAIAVAVGQNRPAALASITDWLTGAKRDGTVARIFAAHDLGDEKVAE